MMIRCSIFSTFLLVVLFICGGFNNVGIQCVDGLSVEQMLEELYCGMDNCYSVLGISQNASKTDMRKAYRRLSIQYHPDRNSSPDAVAQFRKLAKAQEVLSNDANRDAYDYYLAHPTSILALYYGIRAVYPSQTNPLSVILLILFFGTLGQYINSKWKRKWLIGVVEQTPQFKRSMDLEIESRYGAKFRKMNEEEKEEVRNEVKFHLLDTVQLNGEVVGSNPPPFHLTNLFAIQFILLPFTLSKWIWKSIRWSCKYRVLKHPYTTEDRPIMTRWLLEISDKDWDAMEEEQREDLLNQELWIQENLEKYESKKAEDDREARVNSTRYRQWKRWKKKNG